MEKGGEVVELGLWVGIVILIRSCYYWRDEVTLTSREDYDVLLIITYGTYQFSSLLLP